MRPSVMVESEMYSTLRTPTPHTAMPRKAPPVSRPIARYTSTPTNAAMAAEHPAIMAMAYSTGTEMKMENMMTTFDARTWRERASWRRFPDGWKEPTVM